MNSTPSTSASSGILTASAYAVFSVVFLITLIVSVAVTYILPESYASTARLKAEVSGDDLSAVITELEIIRSQLVLEKAIKNLDLNVRWGKRYFSGETLKTHESLEILKARLQLEPVQKTKLISITSYSEDSREAADIANAVAVAYQDFVVERRAAKQSGVNLLIIADPPVMIVDRAEPSLRPCKPNKPLNILLGAAAGVVLGGLTAGLVAFLKKRA